MRKVFAKTQNVKNFINMMNNLVNRADGVPGMALVYGDPGLGKTQSVLWWATQNDAIVVRCTNIMTTRWLLEEIVEELGEVPFYRCSDLFKQCVYLLKNCNKVIIIDEIDYLITSSNVVEILRDLHDKTFVPIVLVGMGKADKKLLRYRHFYDRLSEKLKFEQFNIKDLTEICNQLSEVKLTDCAIKYIFDHTKRFRQIVKIINKYESIAKDNGLSVLDETSVKQFESDLFVELYKGN